MTPDEAAWLRSLATVGGSFGAAYMGVRVSIAKLETWAKEYAIRVEAQHAEHQRRIEELEALAGNGTPGVFMRRDECAIHRSHEDAEHQHIHHRISAIEKRKPGGP